MIFTSDDKGDASLELTYTAYDEGTHTYRLTEIDTGVSNVEYDKSEYTFTVEVYMNVHGEMMIMVDGEETQIYSQTFTNKYSKIPGPGPDPDNPDDPDPDDPDKPDGPEEPSEPVPIVPVELDVVPIIVLKDVVQTSDVKLTKEGYEFVLDNLTTGQKLVRTTDKNGQANFFLCFYEHEVGNTYQFKLTESVPEGADGRIIDNVLYDPTVYNIQVEVVRKYGVPKAVVTINGVESTEAFRKLYFTNAELSGVNDVSLVVKAHKTMKNTGDEKLGPEEFKLILKQVDENGEKIGKTQSQRTSKKGNASFQLPTYTLEDAGKMFRYQIYEKDEGKQGVTYDDTVHEFAVLVRLTEDYKLEADLMLPVSIAEEYAKATEDDELKAAIKELKAAAEESGTAEIQWVDMSEFGWKAEFVNTFHFEKEDVPKTGDESHVDFWFTSMIISLIATIVLLIAELRSRRRYNVR